MELEAAQGHKGKYLNMEDMKEDEQGRNETPHISVTGCNTVHLLT